MSDVLAGITLFTLVIMALVMIVLAARALIVRQVPVKVIINNELTLSALSGQNLLTALKDHNILVPSACAGTGACGLCRVTVTSGAGAALPTERAKLDHAELRKNVRLACQVVLRGDIEARLPSELLGIENWDCRVASTRVLSPFIREIVLALPSGAKPDLRAGSFVQVTAPPHDIRFADFEIDNRYEAIWSGLTVRELTSRSRSEVSRAYSIANRPQDRGVIVLNVRLALPPPVAPDAPPGVVSSFLFSLGKGDLLRVAGPYGSFGATDTGAEMVFIGGGVGMAPLRSIIHDQLERLGTQRKVSFWYGARSRNELYYMPEFNALQKKYENFDWTVALSEPWPDDKWNGAVGFVHDVAFHQYLKDHQAPEECEFYLCGPPLMIRAVMGMLAGIGADSDKIFNDDFGS